jgi:geranylgeranyl reductase family protein
VSADWDVAVVGAGPAGCSAAIAAAAAGARTVLLERAALPRYKTCGGGLIGVSRAALRAAIGTALPGWPTVEPRDTTTSATFTYRGRYSRTLRHREPFLAMVNRDEFDHALAKAAAEAGVAVRDQTRVRSIEQRPDGPVSLGTDDGRVTARAVVGADGSASRVGRWVGVECDEVDLGLELELAAGERERDWRGRILIDWGPLPGSYGWVFPKGERLTVGVISERGEPEATREYLDRFVRDLDMAGLPVLESSGHLTRCRRDGSPLFRGSVLVAGDAAGLLEPCTREGISFALRSGTLAGRAAAGLAGGHPAAADGYRDAVEGELGAEMRAGRVFRAALRRRPWAFHLALCTIPAAWSSFVKLATGGSSYPEALRKWPLESLLPRLAR